MKKACSLDGPAFIEVFAPCPTGWRYPSEKTIELSRLAVETGAFVLWELEGSDLKNIKVTKKPKKRKPIEEYLKTQGRFRHVFKEEGRKTLKRIQEMIDTECGFYGF